MAASTITLPSEKRFLFLGAGPALKCFLAIFGRTNRTAGHAAAVYSDSTLDEQWSPDGDSLSTVCQENGLPLVDGADGATTLQDTVHTTDANICVVFGWNRILGREILQRFQDRIFNFHTGPLPRFRGAGGFSWQVLNNERSVSITIHVMREKIDDGPIILQHAAELQGDTFTPQDIYAVRERLYRETVFPELSRLLVDSDAIPAREPDRGRATYFPMLDTRQNGFLDFSWTPEQFSRFVRAFSDPYPGAIFTYGSARYHVRRCAIVERNEDHHPFCRGLITNVTDDGVSCFVGGGIVALMDITDSDGRAVGYDAFREGNRLFNTDADIMSSILYRPRP